MLILIVLNSAHACTTFVVTPGASEDGSMYIGHTNDGFSPCVIGHNLSEDDIKLAYVPPANHTTNEMRAVRYDPHSSPDGIEKGSLGPALVAYIPEVNHTYGYLTASYGIINEHQLMSGECADFAKDTPIFDPKRHIFYSSELSNIAMERCTKAREAVELVGSLIDRYGYYGPGETLIFADPKDAWVIEMCGINNSTGSIRGLWVARKIPEGDVFVAANTFRIRDVSRNGSDVLRSGNLFDEAEAKGWTRNGSQTIDWLQTVSTGEYSHPYYSLSRIWSIYNRISPSQNLSPYVNDSWSRAYPFSVKPDRKLTQKEVLSLFRDHYEGTVFDLTRGMAADPYGNPYRNDGPFDGHDVFKPGEIKPGAWPRPVSAIFCSYSYIAQGNLSYPYPIGGVCWFGFAQPDETCYIPIYAGISALPEEFYSGSRYVFDRQCAWWAFKFVTNWAMLRYSDMIGDIRAEQSRIEDEEIACQAEVSEKAEGLLAAKGNESCRRFLTDYSSRNALSVIDDWWRLADSLVVKYSNGMITVRDKAPLRKGYPDWWLNETGYQYGPRIYQYDGLQKIPNVNYTGEKISTEPGDELDYIKESQTMK